MFCVKITRFNTESHLLFDCNEYNCVNCEPLINYLFVNTEKRKNILSNSCFISLFIRSFCGIFFCENSFSFKKFEDKSHYL